MPHAELRGAIDFANVHQCFVPRTLTEVSGMTKGAVAAEAQVVTKAQQCYLAADHRTLLFECHVTEGHLRQAFFVLATLRPEGAMIRLHPRSSPEKTDAVKRCVAWLATWVAEGERATIVNTNLSAVLSIPFPLAPSDPHPPSSSSPPSA